MDNSLDPATSRTGIDPDTPLATTGPRLLDGQAAPVVAIALGGGIGACARYAVGLAWPTAAGHFPTSTLLINVIGCAVMGMFMVLIVQKWEVHPVVRPFFGTGVLGGFTTFSTYEVDAQRLLQDGHAVMALVYLAITLLAALVAIWAAAGLTRLVALRSTTTGGGTA